MTHLSSKQWRIVLLILIPLLISFACLPDGPLVDSQTTEVVTAQADLVFGAGPFNLPAPTVGLSDLSSYRETLILSFEGTQDGQPAQWSRTYVMLVSHEPEASQVTVDTAGDTAVQVFVAEVNGALFEQRGEAACTASAVEQVASLSEQWEPARFLSGVIGADEAGAETVNGVASDHYTFDERALGLSSTAQSTGEIWVASDGGYIVKYVLTTEGDADYFGEGTEGKATWNYELTDVNQPVSIELPADCPTGMVDAPLLPDAADMVNMPGLLSYTTVTSLADAVAFYQEQLPSLGWEMLGEPDIRESATILEYQQGDQNLMVIITTGTSVTTVTILLEKAPE